MGIKILVLVAICLIPSTVFADHAITYKEHWDSLCQYDYDRKMQVKGVSQEFHYDLLQKCKDSYITDPNSKIIPDDKLIHNFCDLSCVLGNYKFGENRIEDKDVMVCLDKWWTGKLIAIQCMGLPQYDEFNSKHAELKQLWSDEHGSVIPEFYPMEPFFKQFTDDDAFCLLESEDYRDCLADNGPLENLEIGSGDAYVLLYQGCHNTARNLLASGEMTRAEASYVFNVCEVFPDYILEIRKNIPVEQSVDESEIVCGTGTVLKDGFCVPERATMVTEMQQKSSNGGGCLIATATYGSELAPQVQMLREIRDNSLLQTQSGQSFMSGFNQFYYSFSPTIADYERQNPVFKEAVKVTITPLLASLSLLNYVDLNSEESVLGYGIGIILMNVGMYFVAPAIVISRIRKYKI